MKMRFLSLTILAMACSVSAQAPVSVTFFGPLKIGGPSPVQPGDPTAYPHKVTPRAKFYVLVVAKGLPTMCTFEDCGSEGTLVESLGGWITGDLISHEAQPGSPYELPALYADPCQQTGASDAHEPSPVPTRDVSA